MGDYPKRRVLHMTEEQDALLLVASGMRKKSATFLMREYIQRGATEDVKPRGTKERPALWDGDDD